MNCYEVKGISGSCHEGLRNFGFIRNEKNNKKKLRTISIFKILFNKLTHNFKAFLLLKVSLLLRELA